MHSTVTAQFRTRTLQQILECYLIKRGFIWRLCESPFRQGRSRYTYREEQMTDWAIRRLREDCARGDVFGFQFDSDHPTRRLLVLDTWLWPRITVNIVTGRCAIDDDDLGYVEFAIKSEMDGWSKSVVERALKENLEHYAAAFSAPEPHEVTDAPVASPDEAAFTAPEPNGVIDAPVASPDDQAKDAAAGATERPSKRQRGRPSIMPEAAVILCGPSGGTIDTDELARRLGCKRETSRKAIRARDSLRASGQEPTAEAIEERFKALFRKVK